MSIERINKDDSNQVLIEKLRAIIEIESAKPISEQDIDLIDECVDYLMELEHGIELTQEELEKGKQQVYKLLDGKKKPKKKFRFKGLLIAACLAVLMLLANFVALACGVDTVSILKEWGHNIIEMFEGEKENFSGVTIIKENESLSFDTIESFSSGTSFSVLCPMNLPDQVSLKKIKVTGSYDSGNNYVSTYYTVAFITNVQEVSVIVHTNPDYPKDFILDPNIEIETINGFECYISRKEMFTQCSFVNKDITYVVKAKNDLELKQIIEDLREN